MSFRARFRVPSLAPAGKIVRLAPCSLIQRCAEKIKAETRDSTEVVIAAEAATPYREVLDAMAALRGPDGERFSDVRFGFRRGW